jgi:hypothetical protein
MTCTRPQPSGIRVSDAIEWARTILCLYEGVGAPPTALTIPRESPWRWRVAMRVRSGPAANESPSRWPIAQPLHARLHGQPRTAFRDSPRMGRMATA